MSSTATTAPAHSARRGARPAHVHGRGPRSLQHPAYRTLLLNSLLIFSNRYIEIAATSWLVVVRTDTPFEVTLVSFFRYIPFILAGPVVGVLADRMPRIRIVRWVDGAMGATALITGLLLLSGRLELWHLYAYAALNGILWPLGMPARRAYMVSTVGRRYMTPALALEMLVWTVSNITASNAAGVALRFIAAEWVYFWLAATAVVGLWMIRRLPRMFQAAPDQERAGFFRSLLEGVAYARTNRLLLASFAFTAVANATGSLFEAMAPVFAEDVLHVGPGGLGMLLSATAFGSLVTGVFLAVHGMRIMRVGLTVLIAAFAVHGLTVAWSFATMFAISFGVLAVTGLFTILHGTMNTKLMLAAAPDHMRGRVQGLQFILVGLYPLTSLMVGWLANVAGPGPAVRYMALSGVAALVLVAVMFPELRRRPGPAGPAPQDERGPAGGGEVSMQRPAAHPA